jgi:hypothetical protein
MNKARLMKNDLTHTKSKKHYIISQDLKSKDRRVRIQFVQQLDSIKAIMKPILKNI